MKKNGILMDIGFSCYPFPISPIHIQMICPFHLSPGMQKDLGGHWCETWRSALQPRLPHQRGRGWRLGLGGSERGHVDFGHWEWWFYVVLTRVEHAKDIRRHPRSDDAVMGLKWLCVGVKGSNKLEFAQQNLTWSPGFHQFHTQEEETVFTTIFLRDVPIKGAWFLIRRINIIVGNSGLRSRTNIVNQIATFVWRPHQVFPDIQRTTSTS